MAHPLSLALNSVKMRHPSSGKYGDTGGHAGEIGPIARRCACWSQLFILRNTSFATTRVVAVKTCGRPPNRRLRSEITCQVARIGGSAIRMRRGSKAGAIKTSSMAQSRTPRFGRHRVFSADDAKAVQPCCTQHAGGVAAGRNREMRKYTPQAFCPVQPGGYLPR